MDPDLPLRIIPIRIKTPHVYTPIRLHLNELQGWWCKPLIIRSTGKYKRLIDMLMLKPHHFSFGWNKCNKCYFWQGQKDDANKTELVCAGLRRFKDC